MKVRQFHVKNQFILTDNDGNEYFQSYNTMVAMKAWGEVDPINPVGIYLDPEWKYSKTTSKYLIRFLGVSSTKEIEKKLKSGEYKIRELN